MKTKHSKADKRNTFKAYRPHFRNIVVTVTHCILGARMLELKAENDGDPVHGGMQFELESCAEFGAVRFTIRPEITAFSLGGKPFQAITAYLFYVDEDRKRIMPHIHGNPLF